MLLWFKYALGIYSVDEVTNPVGQLQELVTRLGLRRPQYEADVETGSANDRRFIISVTVGDYTKQGWFIAINNW